jgi:hypothetical protein
MQNSRRSAQCLARCTRKGALPGAPSRIGRRIGLAAPPTLPFRGLPGGTPGTLGAFPGGLLGGLFRGFSGRALGRSVGRLLARLLSRFPCGGPLGGLFSPLFPSFLGPFGHLARPRGLSRGGFGRGSPGGCGEGSRGCVRGGRGGRLIRRQRVHPSRTGPAHLHIMKLGHRRSLRSQVRRDPPPVLSGASACTNGRDISRASSGLPQGVAPVLRQTILTAILPSPDRITATR